MRNLYPAEMREIADAVEKLQTFTERNYGNETSIAWPEGLRLEVSDINGDLIGSIGYSEDFVIGFEPKE